MASRKRIDILPFPASQEISQWEWAVNNTKVTFIEAWHQNCPVSWSLSPQRLPYSLLVFIHEGQSRWQIGDNEFTVEKGAGLIVPEGVIHAAHALKPNLRLSFAKFTARVMGVRCLLTLLGFPYLWEQCENFVEPLKELIRLYTYRPIGWRLRGQAILTDLLLRCVQEEPHRLRPVLAPRDMKALHLLCPAFQLAASTDGKRVSVKELAQAIPCSLTHLRRLFRQAFGISPRQWLLELRLQKAAHLLQTSNKTIQQIADECGFESLSHFVRYFKSRFGTTPSRYREQTLQL